MAGNVDLYKQVAPRSREAATLIPRLYYSAFMAGPTFFANDPRMKTIPGAGEAPWSRPIIDGTDIPRAIREAKASWATAIKIYADPSPQLVRALTREAHKQGTAVIGPASWQRDK